jgi:hypothetical protein
MALSHTWMCMQILRDFMAPSHFPLLFPLCISYWMSRAQLCLCQLLVPQCLASIVWRSAVNSWNHWRTALLLQWEGAFTHYHIFCSWSFFLLLWILYQMRRAQLCLCWLIVPRCLASMVYRCAVDSWNYWRMALLSRLRWQECAFTHYHIFGGWSFFQLLWISYQTCGSQLCLCWLIVPCCLALTVCRSAVNSWNHWRMALHLWLWQWKGAFIHYHIFVIVLFSIAVNFILNEWSPALSLLVDCPTLFGMNGLQDCSQ